MTDLTQQYEDDKIDASLSPESQSATMRPIVFKNPRSDEEISLAASKNNKFVKFDDALKAEQEAEFKSRAKNELGRTAVNVGSWISNIMSGGEADREETRQAAMTSLGIPAASKDDPVHNVLGPVIEITGALKAGGAAISGFKKLHALAQSGGLLRGSATLSQQAAAGIVGETAAIRATSPDTEAAYVELSKAFNLDESSIGPIADLALYAFSHDMDDSEIEKFTKSLAGDALFVKNIEQVFSLTKHIVGNYRKYKAAADIASESVPDIKRRVQEGDITDDATAQRLLDILNVKMPDGPQSEEMLEQIKASLIKAGRGSSTRQKKLVQIEAGKRFTEGSAFVTDDGLPNILLHNGDIKGTPNSYFQTPGEGQSAGFHLTILDGGDITSFEKKSKINPYFVNVPDDQLLKLDTVPGSDNIVNDVDDFISYAMTNDRFDPNLIININDRASLMSDEDLYSIVASQGLDPKGYDVETIRTNHIMEMILDSAGYQGITYKNEIQGGTSLFLTNPDSAISSIYSSNSRASSTLALADASTPLGARVLSHGESLFANELMQTMKQNESEFGIEFTPSNLPAGIDFNFDRILAGESTKQIIDDVSANFKIVIDEAKRGEITHNLTNKMATELDWSVADILKRQEGGTFNAEQMLASRHIMLASASVLDNLAGKINKFNATDADKATFENQLKLHALIQAQVKGAQTEAARMLSSLRISAGANFEGVEKVLDHKSIEEMAAQYAKLQDNAAKNKFATVANKNAWDTYLYVMTNSLLSNPLTQAKNFVGNTAVQLYAIPESLIETGIATTRRAVTGDTEGKRLSAGVSSLFAIPKAFMEGFNYGGRSFATGVPSDKFTKSQQSLNNTITAKRFEMDQDGIYGRAVDLLGFTIGLPGRTLLTQDEFFKGFTYTMQKSLNTNQRLAEDVSKGMDQVEATNRYFNGINGYDSNINEIAIDKAHEATFTKDLDGILGDLQKMRVKHPAIQIMVPFFRAPVNIIGSALKRTPLGVLSGKMRADLMAGGPKADKVIAQIGLGSAITWGAYEMAISGRLTGSGSQDIAGNRHMESVNRQPYSIQYQKDELNQDTIAALRKAGIDISDDDDSVFISYRGIEPIGTMLGLAADSADFLKFYTGDAEGAMEIAALASTFAIKNVGNNTFMRNIHDFTKAVQDPNRYMAAYLAGVVAQSVPLGAILGGAERIDDPEKRVADIPREANLFEQQLYKAMARIQSRIPGWSEELPLGLNLWGDPIKQGSGHWSNLLNPAHKTEGERQAIDFEMERLGNFIQMPSPDIEGIRLSSREYNDMLQIMNSIPAEDENTGINGTFREVLNQLVKLPDYSRLSRDDQINMIDSVKNTFINNARMLMLAKYPTLKQDVIDLKFKQQAERIKANEGL